MQNLLNIFSIKIGEEAVGRNDFLKVLAIISMAIDHVGAIFFPSVFVLRIIGRLALPIFAIGIADGFRYTSNFKKYFLRIFLIGLVSQIPYGMLFGMYKMNILLSFAIALIVLWALKKENFLVFFIALASIYFVHFDYGFYGLTMILLYSFFRDKKVWLTLTQTINVFLNTFFIGPAFIVMHQIWGVLLTIYFPKNLFRVNINKHFFYWFYPGHLMIIWLVKIFSLS